MAQKFYLGGALASLFVALVAFLAAGVAGRRKKSPTKIIEHERKAYKSPSEIYITELGISTKWDGECNGAIDWSEVKGVFIEIMNNGFLTVPYWHISGSSKGIAFPSDSIGNEALIEALRANVPGFDRRESYTEISKAMVALDGLFMIWKRA